MRRVAVGRCSCAIKPRRNATTAAPWRNSIGSERFGPNYQTNPLWRSNPKKTKPLVPRRTNPFQPQWGGPSLCVVCQAPVRPVGFHEVDGCQRGVRQRLWQSASSDELKHCAAMPGSLAADLLSVWHVAQALRPCRVETRLDTRPRLKRIVEKHVL
jgi:hypothetical protein